MSKAGYVLVADHDVLERQHFVVFEPREGRAASATP